MFEHLEKIEEKIKKSILPYLVETEDDYKTYLDYLGENDDILKPLAHFGFVEEVAHGLPVFHLPNAKAKTMIFYLHGGAYVANPLVFHYAVVSGIAHKTDSAVCMPIYKKAPLHHYAEAYDALLAFYQDLLASFAPENILFMGDSAGGGLALGLAMAIRDAGLPQPARLMLLSPWLDLSCQNSAIAEYQNKDPMLKAWVLRIAGESWAGNREAMQNPLCSPLFGNFHGLSPISLFVGTREIFYPDIQHFSNLLNRQSIAHDLFVGEGQFHVYPFFPTRKAAEARKQICERITDLAEEGRPALKI